MAKTDQPLLEQITQSPLLISPNSQQLFQASIQHIVSDEAAAMILGQASGAASSDDDFWSSEQDSYVSRLRPYVVKNGVLMIPVAGVLLNRFPYQFGRWATGYDYIEKALARGLADSAVKGIALMIDSPGGEVAGCFELVDKIFAARGDKAIRAFAADHAYSAAYAIASAADEIVVTRSGGVGSIGVVTAHVEYSEALKDMGIKVTFIFAGDHKVDGNPYEKLSASVKARIQTRIDRLYGVFTATVARNRDMDEKAIRDTEALTYDANDALEVGLADKVGAIDEELITFSEEANDEDEQMAEKNTPETAKVEQAAHDAAVASATAAGAAAEKTRIKAILACDAGKARPKAAMSLAMNTSMSLEEATAVLSDLPEESATVPAKAETEEKKPVAKTPFEAAMEQGNPEVGAGSDKAKLPDDEQASVSILADYAGVAGKKKTA